MATDTLLLTQHLQSELELTTALQSLLRQELTAIRDNQLDTLSRLQQHKQQLLQQLQPQANLRLEWLAEHNLPQDNSCLQRPELTAADDIHQLWHQLENSYTDNQQLSLTLSDLVLTMRKRTIDRLNILRGGQNDPHLYNSNGRASGLNKGLGYTRA